MRWRKAVARMLPWPTRGERQEAIAAARRQKEQSRAGAGHAQALERQIRRMAEENHFALKIAEQIMHGGDR